MREKLCVATLVGVVCYLVLNKTNLLLNGRRSLAMTFSPLFSCVGELNYQAMMIKFMFH